MILSGNFSNRWEYSEIKRNITECYDIAERSSSRAIRGGKLDDVLEEVSVTAWHMKSPEAV